MKWKKTFEFNDKRFKVGYIKRDKINVRKEKSICNIKTEE